jgi:hypothetical protein
VSVSLSKPLITFCSYLMSPANTTKKKEEEKTRLVNAVEIAFANRTLLLNENFNLFKAEQRKRTSPIDSVNGGGQGEDDEL